MAGSGSGSGGELKLQQSMSNLAWDENALMKSIHATHGPESHEINVKPFLNIIQIILNLSRPSVSAPPKEFQPSEFQVEALNLGDMREYLAYRINIISCEILGNCSPGQDQQEILFAIFNALSNFSWNAKGVIVLAAFAVNYGEFWLVTQLSKQNGIASSLALLERLPQQDQEFQKLRADMNTLTRALLDLIKCLCDFKDLKLEIKNITQNSAQLQKAEALFPAALYWIIRSIVICQSQIISLSGMGFLSISSNSEAWEIPTLAEKVIQMNAHLKKQLQICYEIGETNRINEVYQMVVNKFDTTQKDNQVVLEALLGSSEEALFNGLSKRLESIQPLGSKMTLLYISVLEPSKAELSVLAKMYNKSLQRLERDYEIVWIPIPIMNKSSPWNEKRQKNFEATRDSMPWFSLANPSSLDPAVIKFIKNVWKFQQKSILVTLSPKGNLTNLNALYMVSIWGDNAHPFSSIKEEQLWKVQTWELGLLVDGIEPLIHEWVANRRFICLYGGEDMEWIREFTSRVKLVAKDSNLPLEMLYLGTSKSKEKVERNNGMIAAENLSHTMADPNEIMVFWFRLECIWQSRVQRGMPPDTDDIIQESFIMHGFDCSDRGWAIVSRDDEMVKARGDRMLQCVTEYDCWRSEAVKKGFLVAMNEQICKFWRPQYCSVVNWPMSHAGIPTKMACFECGRLMHKFYAFSCCGDEEAYKEEEED